MDYARDNLAVAKMCLAAGLWNPCLHNSQQTVENSLKGLRSHKELAEKRTHDIRILRRDLIMVNVAVALSEDEAELLDSIFMDSKYPVMAFCPTVGPTRPPVVSVWPLPTVCFLRCVANAGSHRHRDAIACVFLLRSPDVPTSTVPPRWAALPPNPIIRLNSCLP